MIGIPVFIDAKNLQAFIDADLREVINKIVFVNLQGKIQEGYDATILPTNPCLQIAKLFTIQPKTRKTHGTQTRTTQHPSRSRSN